MNRISAIIMTLLLSFMLAGCAKQYEVTTKTGKVYTAMGALEYNVKNETYVFKNDEGEKITLNKEDVEVIQEMD